MGADAGAGVAPRVQRAVAHVRERRGAKKNGGNLNGHIWNAALGVEWFPWQHLGFALEYSASRLHLHKDYDEGVAKLDLNSDGPVLYLRARF